MGCCKRTFFALGLFFLEAIDLVLDWDFFVEVKNTDIESVKNSSGARTAILVFAIIGSVTFLLQMLSIYLDSRNDYKYLAYTTTMSFLATWIEDVPQIILAIYIAGISTELISKVQVAKAIYAIIEAVIHIGMSIWQLCCRQRKGFYDEDRETSCGMICLMAFDLIGGILILIASVFLVVELYEDYLN